MGRHSTQNLRPTWRDPSLQRTKTKAGSASQAIQNHPSTRSPRADKNPRNNCTLRPRTTAVTNNSIIRMTQKCAADHVEARAHLLETQPLSPRQNHHSMPGLFPLLAIMSSGQGAKPRQRELSAHRPPQEEMEPATMHRLQESAAAGRQQWTTKQGAIAPNQPATNPTFPGVSHAACRPMKNQTTHKGGYLDALGRAREWRPKTRRIHGARVSALMPHQRRSRR